MPVSTDDYASISDFIGRYCWRVDEGDEEGWAALWTEDGHFEGATPHPCIGHDALKTVPRGVQAAQGRMRHMPGGLHCDYAEGTRDTVIARYYNLVTSWPAGGQFLCLAVCTATLQRQGQSWLMRRNMVLNLT